MTIDVTTGDDGVRILTLNRPPANAVCVALVEDLKRAVEEAEADDAVRAVILRGGRKVFSAGLDLEAMARGELEQLKDLGWQDGLYALWTLSKPTVAEVGGHAVAGGAVLALACDVRIGARGTYKVGLNETAVGVPFPRGAFEIARAALPPMSMSDVILRAELFLPERAQQLGFLHEVVHPAALDARAAEVAAQLGRHPRHAYAPNKALLLEPHVRRIADESDESRATRYAAFRSPEVKAAVEAAVAQLKGKKR